MNSPGITQQAIYFAIFTAYIIHAAIYVAFSPFGYLVLAVARDVAQRVCGTKRSTLNVQTSASEVAEFSENDPSPPQLPADNPYASGQTRESGGPKDTNSIGTLRGMGICCIAAATFAGGIAILMLLLMSAESVLQAILQDTAGLAVGLLIFNMYGISVVVKAVLVRRATACTTGELVLTILFDQLIWIPLCIALFFLNVTVCGFAGF